LLGAKTLLDIEYLRGMEWDPKGVSGPPPDVKRNQTRTLKAKYEEMFDDEMGVVFAFLHILIWGEIVTSVTFNLEAAMMMAHITASPVPVVKTKTVK
jgi:hypothetical protein